MRTTWRCRPSWRVEVDGEGLLVADRLHLAVGHHRPGVLAPGQARPGDARWPPRPPGTGCPRGCAARSPTVVTPRPSSRRAVAGPTPHRARTGRGWRKPAPSSGGPRPRPGPGGVPRRSAPAWRRATPAWRSAWSGPRPRRSPSACRRAPPRWIAPGHASGGDPRRRRAPGHVDEGLVERDALHHGREPLRARRGAARSSPRSGRSGPAGTRRAGTGAGPRPRTWPSGSRRPAPRRCTTPPRRAPRRPRR